ncbi:MAG: methylated-DNA--[protein]-cysteine S-methyltransferase [Candidatus Izemoplasmatales bacterium]|jgi:O-6-methylguanine DNA methyltransferase
MEHHVFSTPYGNVAIDLRGEKVYWIRSSSEPVSEHRPSVYAETAAFQLNAFFTGTLKHMTFAYEIQGTPFQRKVLETLAQVPYGATLSYSELAHKAGYERAVRATANVVARNLLPFVLPCHRIIQKDGRYGNYGGGREMKRSLIDMEKTRTAM